MVPQMRDGPETHGSGLGALHVPPFASQDAGDPIRAVFPGHMRLPGPQLLIRRIPPTVRPLHFQVGVWVDHRGFPNDIVAASLARWQYQALVELPGFTEVRLVWQPGVVGPQVSNEVLHRLQPVGPLVLREPWFPGFFVGEVTVRRHPFPPQMAPWRCCLWRSDHDPCRRFDLLSRMPAPVAWLSLSGPRPSLLLLSTSVRKFWIYTAPRWGRG
jgi:hypothetical protein